MDQQGIFTTPCSAPIKGQSTAPALSSEEGPRGFDFSSPSIHGWRKDSGASRAPSGTQECSSHLRLFREHFIKCVRGSSRAPPEVYPGPYRYTARSSYPEDPTSGDDEWAGANFSSCGDPETFMRFLEASDYNLHYSDSNDSG